MAPKTFTFPPPPPPPPPQLPPPSTDYGFRGQRGGARGRGSGRGAPRGEYSRFSGLNDNYNNTYGNGGGYSNPYTSSVQSSNNYRGNVAYYNPNFIQRNPQLATPQAQANGYLGGPLLGSGKQREAYGEALSGPGHIHLNPRASHGSRQDSNGKRSYNDAFPRHCSQRSPSMVSPAVPSFGAPLPTASSKSANVQIQGKTNKKSANSAVNALGLTPASLGYETSSEEEDDMDEESKLASTAIHAPSNSQVLSISYRGRTHVLRSAEDFANWVEERRKRYPTKAKVEAAAEERLKNGCPSNRPRRGRNAAERKIPWSKPRGENQDEEKGPDDNGRNDKAAKAKLKVEKLRRQLEKAEAKAQDAGREPATLQTNNVKIEPGESTVPEVRAAVDRSSSSSTASSELSTSIDPDDFTSLSDSSDSDSDEAPDQRPLTRRDPEDGLPPRRQHSRPICNAFRRTGRCRFGPRCKYSHEVPTRNNDSQATRGGGREGPKRSTGRISLYQRLVDQEKEVERRETLAAASATVKG